MSSRSDSGRVVLGLDAGTTSAKAVVVDRAARVVATASSDPIATRETAAGGSEQDPEEIWQALATAGRRAVEELGHGVRVAALAVAAQSGSVIPVPVGGPAQRAITWMDTRSRPVVEIWTPGVADRIRTLSGWAPSPGTGLSTIAWLQAAGADPDGEEHQASVDRWASVDDYLVFRLSGQWATNPSNASGMQLMEVSTRAWSPELCRVAGVDPGGLASIHQSGAAAGTLTREAAEAMALDAGTPVVVGGHDQACAALGLDAADPGDVFLSAGTAWVLTIVTDRADVAVLPPGLNLSPHVVPGRWTASTNLGGLGALIAQSPPGSAPAAFRRCAGMVRQALEAAGEMAAGGREMVMVGGGTQFRELIDMIAEAVDRPVVARPDTSWPALGAARLAAAALGWAPRGAPT